MAKHDTKTLIDEAIKAALLAGRLQTTPAAKDVFKATERRLYSIPVLEQKVRNDKENLAEMRANGTRWRSKSIMRFQRSGFRVDPAEMLEAIIRDLEATIAADEYELEIIRGAMEAFEDDPYYLAVTGRYIEKYEDGAIAFEIGCSPTQVWKQRVRLVKDISVMLYGSAATASV